MHRRAQRRLHGQMRREVHRQMRRPRDRYSPPRGRQVPLLLLIAILMLAGMVGMVVVTAVAIVTASFAAVAASLPVLIPVLMAFIAVHSRRREALRRVGTGPMPAPPPRRDLAWARARDRFLALRSEYAAFECDPMEVLRLPALADVSVPSTARFVDAFAEAQALETDQYPPEEHGAAFIAAVDRAERAWRAAKDAADRIRLSGLSPAERATVERVIKLLTTARDSDSDPERLAAYGRARSELAKLDRAGVIHLPRTAEAALDAASRGALPTSSTTTERSRTRAS